MERRKNVIWANVLVGGLLLATLSACNSDEPAATGTPAPTVAAAPDAAPISGATPAPSTTASPGSSPADTKNKDKPKDNSTASAPKPLAPTKPLVAGEIKPDKPLPEKDIEPKAVQTPKPELAQGGLSKSQMDTMKSILDDTKKSLDAGKMEDAKNKFGEFAGGPWEEAAKELKTKAATKHDEIDKAIKAVDAAGVDKEKFSKGLAEVIAALDKAKSTK